jgi:hypothetical protein
MTSKMLLREVRGQLKIRPNVCQPSGVLVPLFSPEKSLELRSQFASLFS